MADSQDANSFVLYRYTPSVPAAAIFVACFAILTVLHSIRLIRNRTWFFIAFVIGLIFELAGYVARIFSHHDKNALGPYIVQTMLILVAPPIFAASIYMTLGRVIVQLHAENASIIRVKWLTKIFVLGDVISFLMQCSGGGYMAAGSMNAMQIGEYVVIGGLAVQLLFFSFFVFVASLFHYRVKKNPKYMITQDIPRPGAFPHSVSWESVMWALYVACVLILIRSIFRVVEFVQGNDGFIMKREYLLYIFDALLMALTGIVLVVVFPGAYLEAGARSKADSEMQLSPTEDSEVMQNQK